MADDVKILVSAPGAKAAAADIQGVGAAAQTAGDATQSASRGNQASLDLERVNLQRCEEAIRDFSDAQAAGVRMTNSQIETLNALKIAQGNYREKLGLMPAVQEEVANAANKETAATDKLSGVKRGLIGRQRSLAMAMRSLGPEFGLISDAMLGLKMNASGLAMGIGVTTAAIYAVSWGIRKWTDADREKKQKAQALLQDLKQQSDAYLDIAASVEKARRAEEARQRPITNEPPGELMNRVYKQQAAVGFGKETAKSVGQSAAVAVKTLTGEELKYFGMWLEVNPTLAEGTPLERLQAFRAYMQQPNAKENLGPEFAKKPGELRTGGRIEGAKGQKATEPAPRAKAALTQVFEGLRSMGIDYHPSRRGWFWGDQESWENVDEFIEDVIGGLKKERFEVPESRPSRTILEIIRRKFPEAAKQIAEEYAFPDEITAKEARRELTTPMNEDRFRQNVNNHFYQGTNYINMDKNDPAGVPVESGM